MTNQRHLKHHLEIALLLGTLLMGCSVLGNIPGGGTGTGPAVSITDNGTTVTMSNGIVAIVITKTSAEIDTINYTFNNTGSSQTLNLLSGGNGGSGGYLYWFQNSGTFIAGPFTESVVTNTGDYAEISLSYASPTNGILDIHYSMQRGSPGFYTTAIVTHRSSDGVMHIELRPNIYAGSMFNWMSVDAARNRVMEVAANAASVVVQGAPKECYLWTNGIYAGQYEDKYKYSADLDNLPAWGWSSVGTGGKNIGIWNVSASHEYYPGGPMLRQLMEHIGTTILNVFTGNYYGLATDSGLNPGETWSHVYGPYLYYCNAVTNTITATNTAAQALYADALAQGVAEQTAWPYGWFSNTNYVPASSRGAVSGQIVIADSGNPNASAANLWVGLVQQPSTSYDSVYDFQQWMKPYQFWTKTDTNGNFTISNVIAGTNYTLYTFGPGAEGTFMSQNQTGGKPPLLYNLPASPFAVTVAAGATNNLSPVTWIPTRVGATVFEIGYPDRTAGKFRHGDDYWVGDIGPSASAPSPTWSKWLEYPFDFPNGVNYTVGQSRWSTDWNFIQPPVTDSAGNYYPSASTINFNLATAPTSGATASLYLGLCSDYYAAIIVTVNGTNAANLASLSASPNSVPSSGYGAAYSGSDSNIREGNNGAFTDERLTFSAGALHAGANTVTISFRETGVSTPPGYFADHFMYDYIRLELTGYVPPAPGSAAAYPGNNCNLVSWPTTPGATSYNVYSTTTSGSNYILAASGVVGPVCGSGTNNAICLDTNAVNGTTYYYVVQSVNPGGASTNSPESPGATPDPGISTSAPTAPTGLTVTGVGHQSVTLNWSPSSGGNFYTIYRSTLVNTGGGSSNTLGTIVLNNTNTGTSYTDTSPTDGSIYSYFVTATGAGGTSSGSGSVVGVALPSAPASAPGSLTGHFIQVTNITLSWSAVSGAVGYVISRATSSSGPYTYLQTVTETTYTDYGLTPGTYYYEVAAENAAGVSSTATLTVIALPGAPASLSAVPGDTQVTLVWTPVSGAAGYYLYSGTSSGNETTLVAPAAYTGTSFTNTGLTDGTTYYYVVAATNAGGLGANSPEASATPGSIVAAPRNLTWKGDGTNNLWNVDGAANWKTNGVATVFNNGDTVTFDNTGSNNVAVTIPVAVQPALVQPALVIVSNLTTHSYTFSGNGAIAGTTALVKTGPGPLIISATNTYTGGTTVSNGLVTFSFGPAIPSTGIVSLYNTGAVAVVTASGLPYVQANGTNAITGNGASGTGISTLDVEGTLNLFVSGGSKVFDLTGPMTGPGTLALSNSSAMSLRLNGTSGDGSALFNLGTLANYASVRNSATAISMGGLAGGPLSVLQGASSYANPVTFTLGGASANAEFDGVIANGGYSGSPAVSIVKTGGNTQTFTNANTYTGTTTVNGGTLLINNPGGSGTGTGSVTVANGGILGGKGIISGAVTVQSGGVLAPGNPLGILTVNNTLTLTSGSTTFMQVGHSPLTNNTLKVSGTLTEGGTLNVTNIGSAALTNGDSFKLFNAGTYSGAFSAYVLPQLGSGLAWNTSALNSSGVISVISLTAPAIGGAGIDANGSLVCSGSGAPTNWTYYVLSSTNLSLPLTNWTRIATNQTDSGGNFSATNSAITNLPQTFLILQFQ
jgi:autotransporter-associated beta strand protein